MSDFHGRIMNLQPDYAKPDAHAVVYKRGFRDARHVAAEIGLEADALAWRLATQTAIAQHENSRRVHAEARLAEEIENAATYKQERDEIYVNYETVAAKLSEAHRQNADLMAIIDKRDEALGFIPLDKGMDMMDELREAKARLAAAEKAIAAVDELIANSRGVDGLHLNGDIASWDELLAGGQFEEWLGDFSAFLRPADSAPAQESDSHG